ncbi:hypothetical protein DW158_18630 [Parabacteroides merdae]|nr:hypothetical protein DW158_18630 [Parabacteroides merdae]
MIRHNLSFLKLLILISPLVGSFFLNRFWVLRMRYMAVGKTSYGGFSCQITLTPVRKNFARNALQATGSSATADLCIW